MRAVMKDETVADWQRTARVFAARRIVSGAGVKTVMLGI